MMSILTFRSLTLFALNATCPVPLAEGGGVLYRSGEFSLHGPIDCLGGASVATMIVDSVRSQSAECQRLTDAFAFEPLERLLAGKDE